MYNAHHNRVNDDQYEEYVLDGWVGHNLFYIMSKMIVFFYGVVRSSKEAGSRGWTFF